MGEIKDLKRLKITRYGSQLAKNNIYRPTPTLSGEGREYSELSYLPLLSLCLGDFERVSWR